MSSVNIVALALVMAKEHIALTLHFKKTVDMNFKKNDVDINLQLSQYKTLKISRDSTLEN
jgi:hypothetical protein